MTDNTDNKFWTGHRKLSHLINERPGKIMKFLFIALLIVIFIALWYMGYIQKGLLSSCNRELQVSTCDEGVNENNALIKFDSLCDSKMRELAEKSDSISLLLMQKESLFETITSLNTQLEACQAKKTIRKPTTTQEKKETTKVEKPAEKKAEIKKPIGRTENLALAGDQYVGIFEGSHGVTISEESRLVYFVSDEELKSGEGKLNIPAPLLNGTDPVKEFYWDKEKNLWVYESNTFITIDRLLDSTPINWCVYIGQNDQWGYEMYNPHEIYKTGSASASSAISLGEIVDNGKGGYAYASKIQYRQK